jgi:phosphoglycerol geranylgeranyltransferase
MLPVRQIGKTEKYYHEKLESQGAMLFSLIDPDKIYLEHAVALAKESYEGGADVILLGGSIGAQGSQLDETTRMIKEEVSIPVVLYPGNISGLTQYADAVYFMHMLNSRDVYWISTALIQAAPVVNKIKIEAIPTTYLIIEPGRAVGWIGNANLIPRDRPDLAAACALAAKYSGSHVVISDSGSGADIESPPYDLIKGIAAACNRELFYFYAGGVRTQEACGRVIASGADGVHVGNAFEDGRAAAKIRKFAEAVRREGKKRV